MPELLKAAAALVVAGIASLTTVASLGHVRFAVAPHPHPHAVAASTEDGVVAISMFASFPAKPLPTPTPEPVSEPAADPSTDASTDAAPATAPVTAAAPSAPVAARVRPPAPPAVVVGSAQQALINSDRAAAGLPPLTWSSCLAGIAYGQSQAMASRGSIFHGSGVNQDFGCGLGSTNTGENVGYWSGGVNDSQLNTMFMNSSEHRANIMGPFHYVGTAWVVAGNGYAYITVEFA